MNKKDVEILPFLPHGRILFPADLREYLTDTFILAKGPAGTLFCFRSETWEALSRGMKFGCFRGHLVHDPQPIEFSRLLCALPEELAEHAWLTPGCELAAVWLEGAVVLCRKAVWEEREAAEALAEAERIWEVPRAA